MSYLSKGIEIATWLFSDNLDAPQTVSVEDFIVIVCLLVVFVGLTTALVAIRQKRKSANYTKRFATANVAANRLRNI